MRRFVINNHKGGSGKTTTAVNLAAALAEQGKKVLLVDLDPQGSASIWFGLNRMYNDPGLFDLSIGWEAIPRLAKRTKTANLDIIPNMKVPNRHSQQMREHASQGMILKEKFGKLAPGYYDYVLFDCSPGLNLVTLNALIAADELLIPIVAHYLVLNGVISLLETIQAIKAKLNPELHISGVLPSRIDPEVKHTMEVLDLLLTKFGKLVYSTYIREDIKLAECPSFTKTILQYSSQSKGARDFRSLAKEVIAQEGKYRSKESS
ncbi:MAG: ParA family protein [Bacteroidota bacterium]